MEPPTEPNKNTNPQPSQPHMFGSPLGSAELPWTWATQQLTTARTYWIATTRPTGQPHTRPIWGIWLNHTFYFSTGSLAAHNLTLQPAITVHLESGTNVLIIEGTAQQVTDPSLLSQIVTLYNQKYHWNLDPNQLPGPFYAVHPQTAFGWHFNDSDTTPESTALKNATRWRFP
jgi:hypothetical protein